MKFFGRSRRGAFVLKTSSKADQFICGNDEAVSMGKVEAAPAIEALCMAFKLLRQA
jgi:hypothetical protein